MDQKETIQKLISELPEIIKSAEYDEFYGYQLDSKGEFYDPNIVEHLMHKLLKAYGFDLEETKKHILAILKWRKHFDPISAAFIEKHDPKFKKIGALSLNKDGGACEKVITWNFYGTIDDPNEVFGHVDEFIRWRVGLMEQALQLLQFDDSTNNYMVQVHDYKGASLFSMTSSAKKASTSIIKLFGDYYPEVLSKKYFVNVPFLMSFLFNAFKSFVAVETRNKLTMMTNGSQLVDYIQGSGIPAMYGNKGGKSLDDIRIVFDRSKYKLPDYVAYLVEEKLSNTVD